MSTESNPLPYESPADVEAAKDARKVLMRVADVLMAVPPIIAQLRKLSPYWSDNGPVAEPEKAFAPVYA